MATRVCFLVDGFNVYHSIVEALEQHKAKPMKWLDPIGLCRSYLSAIHGSIKIKAKAYFGHQLPNPLKVSDTELVWKPSGW